MPQLCLHRIYNPDPAAWSTTKVLDRPILWELKQMFEKELTQAGHVKRFTISAAGSAGWEVRVEQDSHVVRSVCYTDWHRVERAQLMMALQVSELEEKG